MWERLRNHGEQTKFLLLDTPAAEALSAYTSDDHLSFPFCAGRWTRQAVASAFLVAPWALALAPHQVPLLLPRGKEAARDRGISYGHQPSGALPAGPVGMAHDQAENVVRQEAFDVGHSCP